MDAISSLELLEYDASKLQALMSQGQLSSVQLIMATLAQIKKNDHNGLNLQAIISVAPEEQLMKTAALLDEEREAGTIRSPLHGIPIIVKDAIATHPDLGMPTTAGSYALKNSRPAQSATIIEKLIAKGLIILGKANLTELCQFKGNGITSGWSAVGNQTRSAYVKGKTTLEFGKMGPTQPGGSSTGSAVGVSAGYSPLALGTETDGSLMQPASRAALFSLKPTTGIVDMDGVWRISSTLDSVGAMAKSVTDLATVTEILLTSEARAKLPADGYMPTLSGSFSGIHIGFLEESHWRLPDGLWRPDEEARSDMDMSYKNAIEKIRAGGAHVTYPVSIPSPAEMVVDDEDPLFTVMLYEHRDVVSNYLSKLETSEIRDLAELIKFNKDHADLELPKEYPDQSTLIEALDSRPTEEVYLRALNKMRSVAGENGIDRAIKEHALEVIVAPMDSQICSMTAAAGYPIATVPLGVLQESGRPYGLAVFAKASQEHLLFKFMSAYETVFSKRSIPEQLVVGSSPDEIRQERGLTGSSSML